MTPAQVEEEARNLYNSVGSSFWSQQEIFRLIYQAEQILANEAMCIRDRDTSVTTVSGTQAYTVPSLTIAIKRIEYNGQKLKPITQREDDQLTLNNSASTTTGDPLYYWEWNDEIYLRPIPDAAETLTIHRYKEATFLTTASTTLSVPKRYHHKLIDFVVSRMMAKDKNPDYRAYDTYWRDHVRDAKAFEAKRRRTDGFAVVQDEEAHSETYLGVV